MKPLRPVKTTIEFVEGTLTVTDRGVFWDGDLTLTNDQLFSLVTHWYDHYRAPREALGLKRGQSLYKRMCSKLFENVTETVVLKECSDE